MGVTDFVFYIWAAKTQIWGVFVGLSCCHGNLVCSAIIGVWYGTTTLLLSVEVSILLIRTFLSSVETGLSHLKSFYLIKCTWTQIFFVSNFNLSSKSKHILPFRTSKCCFFVCHASYAKLAKQVIVWTHDRAVRSMDLFSILRNKLVCNAKALCKLECKAVRDVELRIGPRLSQHGRGSTWLRVLLTLHGLCDTWKVIFRGENCFRWKEWSWQQHYCL